MENRSSGFVWGMIVLAVGLVVAACIGAWAVVQVKRANDTITVTGSVRKPIVSDYIVWRGQVSSQDPSMQAAYANVKRYSEKLHQFFAAQGIPDSDVTFQSIQTNDIPQFDSHGRITGRTAAYRLWQGFSVESNDVDRILALSQAATDLINQGVELNSYSPEFIYTKLDSVRIEMLAEAAKDARERAVAIASSVGAHVGAVRGARMGVFQITPRHSTAISNYGLNDTSSRDKDITAVVGVTFAIE